jgi:hypothetical protein
LSDGRFAVEPQTSEWLRSICYKVSQYLQLGSRDGPAQLIPIILRHTCITEFAEAGVPIEQIATFAGHASLKSTEHYYGLGVPYRMPGPPRKPTEHARKTLADVVMANASRPPPNLVVEIEMDDAVCESVITGADCCAVKCLACPYKELTTKDLPRIERIVEHFSVLCARADALGLTEKVREFNLIYRFNEFALSVLREGRTFRGDRDLPETQLDGQDE